jgi:low affinity Fe/Cu permease
MKNIYRNLENGFEMLVTYSMKFLGNSVTFIFALCIVIFWLTNKQFYRQDFHACVGDLLLSVAFLSLFIIQKSFNRFAGSLHIKLNELIASHEPANNAVINLEQKTEHEITALTKEYADLVEQIKEEIEEDIEEKPEHKS